MKLKHDANIDDRDLMVINGMVKMISKAIEVASANIKAGMVAIAKAIENKKLELK